MIYGGILAFSITRFLDIAFERTYNTLTLYQPLDMKNDQALTIGKFFTAANIKAYYEVVPGDKNCQKYTDTNYVQFYGDNPKIYMPFTATYDDDYEKCRVDFDPTILSDNRQLYSNFTI